MKTELILFLGIGKNKIVYEDGSFCYTYNNKNIIFMPKKYNLKITVISNDEVKRLKAFLYEYGDNDKRFLTNNWDEDFDIETTTHLEIIDWVTSKIQD